MSFNVRLGTGNDGPDAWPHRRPLLLRTIDAFRADVLGTQELLAFQADELREHLKGYGFIGVGRDDGARKGEFCGVYYRTDRFDADRFRPFLAQRAAGPPRERELGQWR